MVDKEPKKPINDDIRKCREDILKATGINPPTPSTDKNSEDVTNIPPVSPKIPSFEELMAKDLSEEDEKVEIKEISQILSDTGPVDIDNVFEDEERIELIDEPDDTAGFNIENTDDTDWDMIESPSSNLEDVPMDCEDDQGLEIIVNNDNYIDNQPLVTRQEQDYLIADIGFNEVDLTNEEVEEDSLIKQMEQGLAALSAEDDIVEIIEPETETHVIPEFDVYDKILSNERKQSATKRQRPKPKTTKTVHEASGTVGDIIKESKGVSEEIKKPERNVTLGIIHRPENMNNTQQTILEEIVASHIEALCA